MASKRLDRSWAGRDGVRERAWRLLGDTEAEPFRGNVLALLLAGKVEPGVWPDLRAEGEAALAGR